MWGCQPGGRPTLSKVRGMLATKGGILHYCSLPALSPKGQPPSSSHVLEAFSSSLSLLASSQEDTSSAGQRQADGPVRVGLAQEALRWLVRVLEPPSPPVPSLRPLLQVTKGSVRPLTHSHSNMAFPEGTESQKESRRSSEDTD